MDKVFKGLVILAAGSITFQAFKTIREYKKQKELCQTFEVADNDSQNEE